MTLLFLFEILQAYAKERLIRYHVRRTGVDPCD